MIWSTSARSLALRRKPDTSVPAAGLGAAPRLLKQLAMIGVTAPEVLELFDYIEDVLFWMKDWDGHYQWVNMSFLLNFGLPRREEVLGRTDFDLCGVTMANHYRLDDERVLRGERILSRVELVGRFDHSSRLCVTSKIPLRDQAGRIVGTAGVTAPLDKGRHGTPVESPLNAAIVYVGKHYAETITNRDLARACGLSLRAFERHFFATYQTSPHDYVRQMRVRLSSHALVYSHKTLAEIAQDYGFADQSHFTKEFARVMHETPGAYRSRFVR